MTEHSITVAPQYSSFMGWRTFSSSWPKTVDIIALHGNVQLIFLTITFCVDILNCRRQFWSVDHEATEFLAHLWRSLTTLSTFWGNWICSSVWRRNDVLQSAKEALYRQIELPHRSQCAYRDTHRDEFPQPWLTPILSLMNLLGLCHQRRKKGCCMSPV